MITLGTEAFRWFAPYAESAEAFEEFWRRDNRYESEIGVTLKVDCLGQPSRKALTILPLPHPSPLNQRWYKQFPELLGRRLVSLGPDPR